MGLLKKIGGIPLYSTVQEAITWAERNGLKGAHIHRFDGIFGYMGGASHSITVEAITPELEQGIASEPIQDIIPTPVPEPIPELAPMPVPVPVPVPTPTPTPTTPPATGGGGY